MATTFESGVMSAVNSACGTLSNPVGVMVPLATSMISQLVTGWTGM